MEFIREHLADIAGLVALGVLSWFVLQAVLRSAAGGSRMRVTAYCLHCNWEGAVVRDAMKCARCKSTNLSVVSTGARAAR